MKTSKKPVAAAAAMLTALAAVWVIYRKRRNL